MHGLVQIGKDWQGYATLSPPIDELISGPRERLARVGSGWLGLVQASTGWYTQAWVGTRFHWLVCSDSLKLMQDNRVEGIEGLEDQDSDVGDDWDEWQQGEEEEDFVDENTEYEFDLNNPFWKLYLETKPRGNSKSWAEDIGLPPSVLVDAWGFCVEDEEFAQTFHPIDLLRLCSWLRKHSTYRSSAAEWNTSKTTFKRRAWMLLVAFDKIFGKVHLMLLN